MKKLILSAALGATAIVGVAYAAQPGQAPTAGAAAKPPRGPMRLDTNHDGVIGRDEFLATADKRFERLDFNRDGQVSEETMMAMRGPRGGMHGRGMGRGMKGMRGPGPAAMPRPGTTPGVTPGTTPPANADRFAALDTNRDGQLTLPEFRAQAATQFAKLDANTDGRLDSAEMATIRGKLRGRMGMHGMRGMRPMGQPGGMVDDDR